MLRSSAGTDPLLGRPFALYDIVRDAEGAAWAVDVVYLVIGRGTAALARAARGDRLSVWGPLGNGFEPDAPRAALFVAGGIGQTPFLSLGRWWLGRERYGEPATSPGQPAASCRMLYGVRSADLLAGLPDFERAGIPVETATDDGSAGHHGRVTDLLARAIERGERPDLVVGCGPPPMLAALARLVEKHALSCLLSLENHMACGFGACFSCVAPIRQDDGSVDLKRVCVEGPIFDAARVILEPGTH
jgi:dihydroorotate dehydrogenase electron transfer subunit